MSKSNTTENDFMLYTFNGTAFSWNGNTNLYIALHTADPGEAGTQTTSEATYTSYARVTVARTSGGFTVSGTLSVTPYATGQLEAEITPFTELSPQNLAAAVWNEQYSSYDTAGTFGKLLQDAGGGSSPEVIASAVWDELLTTHNISGSYGEKVKKLLTLAQFLALKD